MERGPSHLDLHTEELVVGVTLRPSLHYNVEASASILLAHDGIINAVPLLRFRVLPGLFKDVTLFKPGVAHRGLHHGEKHEELFTGIISKAITMRAPHSAPWVVSAVPGAYPGIEVSEQDVWLVRRDS